MSSAVFLATAISLLGLGEPAQKNPSLSPADLKPLLAKDWRGTLTYLDYTSNKPTSIESTLSVAPVQGKPREWTFAFGYPKEPEAKSSSIVKLSNDGRTFDGATLRERRQTKDSLVFVVEAKGKDDNRSATIERTYTLTPSEFSIRKRVRFSPNSPWIIRHTYSWAASR